MAGIPHINLRPELENELIHLVPLNEQDFEKLYQVASDPLIWEQHPTSDRYKREVFQLFFDGAIKSKSAFLVFDKKSKELIGSSRYYDYKEDENTIAIGYTFLARKYWGGTYNKALKKLMLNYIFQHVHTVLLHVGKKNIRSQKALLNIGAQKIKEVDFNYYGDNVVHYEYAIKKEDWKMIVL